MTTKFDPNDIVFTMHENKVIDIKVQRISITADRIVYILGQEKEPPHWTEIPEFNRRESNVFSTKEDLIASL